ncbi:ankyrin repeat-containing domain protein [Chytridium lagenaria]|nr:ankyrin repeat-containing domain protein [Chytridium lagenaria]
MLDQIPIEILSRITLHMHPYDVTRLHSLSRSTPSRLTFIQDVSFAHLHLLHHFQRPPTNLDVSSIHWYRLPQSYWTALITLRGFTERTLKMLVPSHFVSHSLSTPTTFPARRWMDDAVTRCVEQAEEYGRVDMTDGLGSFFERGYNIAHPVAVRVLNSAVTYGYLDIVVVLLERLKEVEVKNLVVLAATVGHVAVFKLLVERVGGGKVVAGEVVEVEEVIEGEEGEEEERIWVKRNVGGETGMLSLRFASTNGHVEIVKLLLSYGCDPRHVPDNRALTGAARNGHLSILRLLLDSHAIPTTQSLINASENGHSDIVCHLLSLHHPRIDASAFNNRALKAAACLGHEEVVRVLLGCDEVDPGAENGFALRMARANGHMGVVRVLVEDGRAVGMEKRREVLGRVCGKVVGCDEGCEEVEKAGM